METAQKSLDILVGLEKIKAWSLIVTLFGDLEASSSQSLSGKQINSLLSHIGIKPEATRVALHRLKNEEWIETSKTGRETLYRLSKKARIETASVYCDVYGTSIKYPQGWQLYISQDHDEENKNVKVQVLKNVSLVPILANHIDAHVLKAEVTRSHVPDWFAEKIINPNVFQTALQLTKIVSQFDKLTGKPSKMDKTAIRLLVLHHWRKMALRDSIWCYIWLVEQSALAKCQKAVSSFLKKTSSINASTLSDQI